MRFRGKGLLFRGYGLRFRVREFTFLGFTVYGRGDAEFRVQGGLGFRVKVLGFMV